jgi:hypothetical protein
MKGKVVSILTVGLVTLAVLSPELVVFGIVWQRHLELEKIYNADTFTTNIDLDVNIPNTPNTRSYLKSDESNSFLHSFETQQKLNAVTFVQELSALLKKYSFFVILQRLLLFIPIGISITIFIYDRYLSYRATVYKEQVDMLEKMWHFNIEKEL